MIIADGKAIAQKELSQIKTDPKGQTFSVAAIWVGNDQTIGRFVEMKKKHTESVGVQMVVFHFDSSDPENNIIDKIKELSENKEISGIVVELPLPDKFNRDKILNSISKEKDIDVLSASAQEDFYNNSAKLIPPSVGALELLFKEYGINPKGKAAAVFGQSMLIGKPISHYLEQAGAKVFRIDEFTSNPEEFSRQADIIISGVGKPNLIKGNMIKEGSIIVDFGFEKLGDRMFGDIDFDSTASKTSLITPVPGGMGPLVIVSFLKNVVLAKQNSCLK